MTVEPGSRFLGWQWDLVQWYVLGMVVGPGSVVGSWDGGGTLELRGGGEVI